MILSDREIRLAQERGAARITPPPPVGAYSATGVDLRLAAELQVWKQSPPAGVEQRIRLGAPDISVPAIIEQLTDKVLIPATGFELLPQQFVLGWTAEKVQLPHRSRLAGRVEGKSSWARLGLGIHVTAPTIHAGFGYDPARPEYEGSAVQLEIWNTGKLTLVLEAGIPICQLIFEVVDGTPEKGYSGQFNLQGPVT
jgi:dCTP deaminase